MAIAKSTPSCATDNLDLLRRYTPQPLQHTHEQLAACIWQVTSQGCWLWAGPYTPEGYGYVSCEPTPYGLPQVVGIHRYMTDILVGDIPYGYHVHHRCYVKHCWNPIHLEMLTPQEHWERHHPKMPERQLGLPWHPAEQLELFVIN